MALPPDDAEIARRQADTLTQSERRRETKRQDQKQRRDQRRQDRKHNPILCRCGAAIFRPAATLCTSCYADVIGTGIRNGRQNSRRDGPRHVCPNCGREFFGYETDVYCSPYCGRQYNHERYPSLQDLSRPERNHLAEMIALVRQARRHINQTHRNPTP